MALNDTDGGILFLLQQDARGNPTRETAERVGASASTVRNCIEPPENRGIIRGDHGGVDYDEAGLQLYVEFSCSARHPRRTLLAAGARAVGAVASREVLDRDADGRTDAVGTASDHVARMADENGDVGPDVVAADRIEATHLQPFDHSGQQPVEAA